MRIDGGSTSVRLEEDGAIASRAADDRPAARRVELLTPVPPLPTGTAAYVRKLLRGYPPALAMGERMVIGADPLAFDDPRDMPSQIEGVPVVDYRSLSPTAGPQTLRVFFLANNNYHAFVLNALEREPRHGGGRLVCVLHDVSIFMLNRYMIGNGAHRRSEADLADAIRLQYGEATDRLLKRRFDGDLPELFEHVSHGQSLALTRADEIWVHSLYALVKLQTESRIAARDMPRIRVVAHPRGTASSLSGHAETTHRAARTHFRIGLFGFVTPPKRVPAVLRGLALARARLGPDADAIRLLLVGRFPPGAGPGPMALAEAAGVEDITETIEDPPDETFEALQRDCDLIFALRYPSSGETSGPLASAAGSGAPTVTTRYQAFREVAGVRSITMLPHLEDWSIAAAICDAFQAWQSGRETAPSVPETAAESDICPLDKLLLLQTLNWTSSLPIGAAPNV